MACSRSRTMTSGERDKAGARRKLALWLRGAGDPDGQLGASLTQVREVGPSPSHQAPDDLKGMRDGAGDCEDEAPFRELFYSTLGGFDQRVGPTGMHPLDKLRPHTVLPQGDWQGKLKGRNTLFELSDGQLKREASAVLACVKAAGPGTRVTVRAKTKHASWLGRIGFREWRQHEGERAPQWAYMHAGRRGVKGETRSISHDETDRFMDPRDLGIGAEDKSAKRLRAWKEIMREPAFNPLSGGGRAYPQTSSAS